MKLKLIANPVAGGDARRRIAEARKRLEARGCSVDLFLTGARGDAARAAAAAPGEGYDRIVAAGGDGTLCEVLDGLAPSALPVAFLPLGTTNVFALEASIPFDVAGACDVALDGEVRAIALGEADGSRFLLMAGIGFDAEVVHGVSLPLKRRTGKFAYLASALSALLRHRPAQLEVTFEDGSVVCGYGAVIGNGRLYGGRFSVTPGADLEEDLFEACLLLRPGRLALLRCIAAVALGRHPGATLMRRFKARSLAVRGKRVPVQLDGDPHEELPMNFRVLPQAAHLVFPPRQTGGVEVM